MLLTKKLVLKREKKIGKLLKNTFYQRSGTYAEKNNLERNKIQVDMINSGLKDLKEEIANMSEEEKKNRKTK